MWRRATPVSSVTVKDCLHCLQHGQWTSPHPCNPKTCCGRHAGLLSEQCCPITSARPQTTSACPQPTSNMPQTTSARPTHHPPRLLLAFSALEYHSEALLAVLDVAVDARLQSMPPSQLSTALWAMAKEEHVPSATVLARAEEACIKGFRGFTPGQAAVVRAQRLFLYCSDV